MLASATLRPQWYQICQHMLSSRGYPPIVRELKMELSTLVKTCEDHRNKKRSQMFQLPWLQTGTVEDYGCLEEALGLWVPPPGLVSHINKNFSSVLVLVAAGGWWWGSWLLCTSIPRRSPLLLEGSEAAML